MCQGTTLRTPLTSSSIPVATLIHRVYIAPICHIISSLNLETQLRQVGGHEIPFSLTIRHTPEEKKRFAVTSSAKCSNQRSSNRKKKVSTLARVVIAFMMPSKYPRNAKSMKSHFQLQGMRRRKVCKVSSSDMIKSDHNCHNSDQERTTLYGRMNCWRGETMQ